jgi:hypothetical protein
MKSMFQSFITGMAHAFDLFGVLQGPPVSDYDAIKSDWEAVGRDLAGALGVNNKII